MHGQIGLTTPKPMTPEDLPWALSLAWDRYQSFDPGAAAIFFLNCCKSAVTLKIRRPNAFLIATIVNAPWEPKQKECHGLVLCAAPGHHWEAVSLLRQSVVWSHQQGCARWWFTSDLSSIDALCRRVGAKRETRYTIEL
jgi:hypothetical protein